MNKIFQKVPVQIQNRSGFDCSHQNVYTMNTGTLVPVLVDQLIPGDWISLGHLTEVQLPPMATDFYGRIQFKMEVFFVPNRICYGGFQQFITQPSTTIDPNNNGYSISNVKYLPHLKLPLSLSGPGSLADYLGFKRSSSPSEKNEFIINNSLPFIAYHKIWNDWYRDSNIQKECFRNVNYGLSNDSSNESYSARLPYITLSGDSPVEISNVLADGYNVFNLRQRNWPKDYFTNCTLEPQSGTPATLAFNIDNNELGSFTIASLRAANSLQQWMERNNIAGSRYIDQIRAHYGVTPSDAIMDRPVYLGSHSFDIYNKGIYQSAPNTSQSVASSNPMQGLGSKFGSSMGVSDSSLVDSFKCTEFGFLFVLASIVPDALYSSGQRRYLDYQVVSDFANPILSAVGDQEIKIKELVADMYEEGTDPESTFGYTQRYSEYKFMLDEVHGIMRDGSSLSSFALQRSFDPNNPPELSSIFLEIPPNYLDQVTTVRSWSSQFGAWANTFFKYKKSSVLPAYSIPTLGDPKDTHIEVVPKGGTRL